uniref:Uncharacterized protein n=1 Tax=Anguilla anguilla TaxID=7936 RepID=A0A0E9WNZ2_ANGAN
MNHQIRFRQHHFTLFEYKIMLPTEIREKRKQRPKSKSNGDQNNKELVCSRK